MRMYLIMNMTILLKIMVIEKILKKRRSILLGKSRVSEVDFANEMPVSYG